MQHKQMLIFLALPSLGKLMRMNFLVLAAGLLASPLHAATPDARRRTAGPARAQPHRLRAGAGRCGAGGADGRAALHRQPAGTGGADLCDGAERQAGRVGFAQQQHRRRAGAVDRPAARRARCRHCHFHARCGQTPTSPPPWCRRWRAARYWATGKAWAMRPCTRDATCR